MCVGMCVGVCVCVKLKILSYIVSLFYIMSCTTFVLLFLFMLNISGPCPHGYKDGDTWSAGIRCGGCSCHSDGWNCVT